MSAFIFQSAHLASSFLQHQGEWHISSLRSSCRCLSSQTTRMRSNYIPRQPSACDQRQFSNVAPDASGQLRRARASDIGCAALVSGTMVGAGVLALPAVSAPAGFVPAATALVGVWAYMLASALLITEVSVSTACSLGRPSGVSLLSLGRVTLGPFGGLITGVAYTFLHYAILTAYVSQGGTVLSDLYTAIFRTAAPEVYTRSAPFAFAFILGGALYSLPDSIVEQGNNALVLLVALSFAACLLSLTGGFSFTQLILPHNWTAVPAAVPTLFVSCVFHNVVGTVASRLEGDLRRIRRVLAAGSVAPLVLFLCYDAALLGRVGGFLAQAPAQLPADLFAISAIATSFVGFVAGLVDLWADVRATSMPKIRQQQGRSMDYIMTIIPPAAFCAVNPDVFLAALDAAGTYGIAVLFGILPAAMAWRLRERMPSAVPHALPGGNFVLVVMAAVPAVLIAERVLTQILH